MFLFISGVSTFISYHNRLKKISEDYTFQTLKKEYFFRALIIMIIALLYNVFVAIRAMDPSIIWTWFMLLSISFSLFIAWPLLKTSKSFRIGVAISVFIINEILYRFLIQYQNKINFYGIIYYFLYNIVDLEPILVAFPFFLIGTVVGDLILDIYNIEDQKERRKLIKKNLVIPSLITGLGLILFTMLYIFPDFFQGKGFYWIYFSMGVCLIFFLSLLLLEEYGVFNTEKSYKFLFFYSYYSLTVYLTHNALYFLFYNQLNVVFFWLYSTLTIILYELLLKLIYKKFGPNFSVKIKIGQLALGLSKRL
jgi:hypothetical protein